MAERIDKIYHQLDEKTKKDYGSDYLSAYRQSVVGNDAQYAAPILA